MRVLPGATSSLVACGAVTLFSNTFPMLPVPRRPGERREQRVSMQGGEHPRGQQHHGVLPRHGSWPVQPGPMQRTSPAVPQRGGSQVCAHLCPAPDRQEAANGDA